MKTINRIKQEKRKTANLKTTRNLIKILMIIFLLSNCTFYTSSDGGLLMPEDEWREIAENYQLAVIELNEDNTADVHLFIALNDLSGESKEVKFFIPMKERVINETFDVEETNLEEFTGEEDIDKLEDLFMKYPYYDSRSSSIPTSGVGITITPIERMNFGSTNVEVYDVNSDKKLDELIDKADLPQEFKKQYRDYGDMYAYLINMKTKPMLPDIENESLKINEYCPKTHEKLIEFIKDGEAEQIKDRFSYHKNFHTACMYEYYLNHAEEIESEIRENIEYFNDYCPNASSYYLEAFNLLAGNEIKDSKTKMEYDTDVYNIDSYYKMPLFENLNCYDFQRICSDECKKSSGNPFVCGVLYDSINNKLCNSRTTFLMENEIYDEISKIFQKLYRPALQDITGVKISYKLNLMETNKKDELKFWYPLGTGKLWKQEIALTRIYAVVPKGVEVEGVNPKAEDAETSEGDTVYLWSYENENPGEDIEITIKSKTPVNGTETAGDTSQIKEQKPDGNTLLWLIIILLIILIVVQVISLLKR